MSLNVRTVRLAHQKMSGASPKLMFKSPRANPSVLKVEFKLNLEEASRLQEQAQQIEAETKQLRSKLKQLKHEAKNEINRRMELINQEQVKHEEELNARSHGFAATKQAIRQAREQKVKDSLIMQQLGSCRGICDGMKQTIQSSMKAVHANIQRATEAAHGASDAAKNSEASQFRAIENKLQAIHDAIPEPETYKKFPKRPVCAVSEAVAFEFPGEPFAFSDTPKEVTHVMPVHLVETVKWVNPCFQ